MILKNMRFFAALVCFSVIACSVQAEDGYFTKVRGLVRTAGEVASRAIHTLGKPHVAATIVTVGAGLVLMNMLPEAEGKMVPYCELGASFFNTSLSEPIFLERIITESGEEAPLYAQFGYRSVCYSSEPGFFQGLRDGAALHATELAKRMGYIFARGINDEMKWTSVFYKLARDRFSEVCFRGEEEASCRNIMAAACSMAGDSCRASFDTASKLCAAWLAECFGATR
jgi:hypothetical protein